LTRTPSLADSTALEPLGTNLFVRNYQPISRMLENTPPVTPALARTNSVNPLSANQDKSDSPQAVTPATANRHAAAVNGKDTTAVSGARKVQTAVRGQLLK
jgi:hypothetical protein